MKQTNQISRRHFLRGAGVALALPWLESLTVFAMPIWAQGKAGVAEASKPPLRFAHIFFSNGVEPVHWWAKGRGAEMTFGPGAEPLTAIREDIVFLRGLYHQKALSSTSPHLCEPTIVRMPPLVRSVSCRATHAVHILVVLDAFQ